jgi:hypothetical protein
MLTAQESAVAGIVNVRVSPVRHGPVEEFHVGDGISEDGQTSVAGMGFE